MDKTYIIEKAKTFLEQEYELRQDMKKYLSEILANTSEDNPKDVHIYIDEDFYFGLSNVCPYVSSCWLDDTNETIYFQIDYCGSPTDFENMRTDELITVVDEIDYQQNR